MSEGNSPRCAFVVSKDGTKNWKWHITGHNGFKLGGQNGFARRRQAIDSAEAAWKSVKGMVTFSFLEFDGDEYVKKFHE